MLVIYESDLYNNYSAIQIYREIHYLEKINQMKKK